MPASCLGIWGRPSEFVQHQTQRIWKDVRVRQTSHSEIQLVYACSHVGVLLYNALHQFMSVGTWQQSRIFLRHHIDMLGDNKNTRCIVTCMCWLFVVRQLLAASHLSFPAACSVFTHLLFQTNDEGSQHCFAFNL
jgi:hypothetical protein